jgi:hypothetical protein
VASDQVGGDAIEPRTGVPARGVVAVPLAERDQERFRDQVVGVVGPDPTGQVPVDLARMPIEQRGESFGIITGLRDQTGVVRLDRGWPGHTHVPALTSDLRPLWG